MPGEAPQVQPQVVSRERIAVRTRESGVTLSAWRIELSSPRGAIVMVDLPRGPVYRGEGALLGKPQAELKDLWVAALPSTDAEPEPLQLG